MLEEMLEYARAGRVPAFGFIAEIDGCELVGVTGHYKADPKRALGAIDRVRRRVSATSDRHNLSAKQ